MFVQCCSSPAPWIQPFLLPRDSRLRAPRAPSFPTPVDEFLSPLCTMPSPSSLPALPLAIYGCTPRAGHICVLPLAPAQDRVALTAAASTQRSVPQQLHPLGIRGLPNADFPKMHTFRGCGGGEFTQKYQNVSPGLDAAKSLNSKTLDRLEM